MGKSDPACSCRGHEHSDWIVLTQLPPGSEGWTEEQWGEHFMQTGRAWRAFTVEEAVNEYGLSPDVLERWIEWGASGLNFGGKLHLAVTETEDGSENYVLFEWELDRLLEMTRTPIPAQEWPDMNALLTARMTSRSDQLLRPPTR